MASPRRAAWLALLPAALALAGCLGGAPPAPPSECPEPDCGTEPVEPTEGQPPLPGGSNLPPTARFEFAPLQPVAGEPVQFVDRSTDPDDGVAGRVWLFPDGSKSQMARATFTFAAPGRFTVFLSVSDRAGQTNSTSQSIVVLSAGAAGETLQGPRPHVVVAVIDTGVNPYHDVFRARPAPGDPAGFLGGFPADARPLPLTLGPEYAEARGADAAAWRDAREGQLYWVPGTRIVGAISFGGSFDNAGSNEVPILDEDGHGTATASRVALASPHALLVAIEAGSESIYEAIAWAAAQPWIDLVSISAGPPANAPLAWPFVRFGGLDVATRGAVEAGKLVFAAAGNEPTPTHGSHLSGPAWVVAVGGVLPGGKGDPATASKGMDLVSDYVAPGALHDRTAGTEDMAGTSFSAPNAAGVAAEALYELRASQGWLDGIVGGALVGDGPGLLGSGLRNAELRAALEGTAAYWGSTEWSPVTGAPIAPAPWVQMGWGYVGPDTVAALVRAALAGDVPAKSAEARAYMGAVLASREAFWG